MQSKYAYVGPIPRVNFTMTPRVLHFFDYVDPKTSEVKRLSANARVLWDWLMQLSAPGMIYQYIRVYGKHPLLERELSAVLGFSRGKIQYLKRELEDAGLISIARSTSGQFTTHTITVNEIWQFNEAFSKRWGELVAEGEQLKRGEIDTDAEEDQPEGDDPSRPTIGPRPTIGHDGPTIGRDGPTISQPRPTIGPLINIVRELDKERNGSPSPDKPSTPKRRDPLEDALNRQERNAKEPWRLFLQEIDVPDGQRMWAAYFAVLLGHTEDGKPSDARIGTSADKRKSRAERREWMATTEQIMKILRLKAVPVGQQKDLVRRAVEGALLDGQKWRNPGSFATVINGAVSAMNRAEAAPADGGPIDLDALNQSVMGGVYAD